MDSLIRLDVLMPIAPVTENRANVDRTTAANIQSTSPQQTVNDAAIVLEGVSDVIDLTNFQGDGKIQSNCDKDLPTMPIPLTFPQDKIMGEESGGNHRSVKHKLPPNNHSPSKVSRIDFCGPLFRPTSIFGLDSDSNQTQLDAWSLNSQGFAGPSGSREIVGSTHKPPITKTHTVTSVGGGSQAGINLESSCGAVNSFRSNSSQQMTNIIMSDQSIENRELNHIRNGEHSQAFHRDIMTERDFQTELMQQNYSQTNNNNLKPIDCQGNESTMFYQLLDMFPDIDLNFLESQCRQGLDINQVTENILGMNDYPKYNCKAPDLRILTPKELNNLNIPPSSSTSTTCTRPMTMRGDITVLRKPEEKKSVAVNFSSGSTSTTCIRPMAVREETLLPGEKKSEADNNSSSGSSSRTLARPMKAREETVLPEEKKSVAENSSVDDAPTPILFPNDDSKKTQISTKDYPTTNSPERQNNVETGKKVEVNKIGPTVTLNEDERNILEKRSDNNCINGESQFSFLMEIFPDADPTFMEMKSKLKGNELRNFIDENVEKHDYPKVSRPTCSEKKENEDESIETDLYTTNFVLENFIKIFPVPFGYFLDEKRNCQYSAHGIEFLKRRYRCHSIKLINMKYREFKYNLVKTCEYLDVEKPSRSSKRGLHEIRMPEETNLPFLQEACFIEHKTEIKNYLDAVVEGKRLSYMEAEAKGELIECGCCYQSVLFEDCATCNEGHLFCKSCVRKSVEVRIGDTHTTFPCLQDCDSVFSLRLLETLVDATMFSRLLQRIQLDEVRAADIDGLEVCPFCDFAIILPPETSIFKCLNPECLRESCRKCHRLSHIPQRCEEVESDDQARARKYIEDEMTRALVRQCYKCKKAFVKIDGCNKMTCVCGAKMCYICREPIVDYKHFNGPGGEENKKCPLYSTEKLLHVDAVEAVAKKALEEVTSKNPELKLKHDPSKILPEASTAKTTLPPGVNEEAQRLINMLQNLRQQNG